MTHRFRKLALFLCLTLVLGLLPASGPADASSKMTVKLIIANKFVTKKTYKLRLGLHRQISVRINNAPGKIITKFSSDNTKIATVSKKGLITTKKVGKVKIRVKVTSKVGKKKTTKKTWVKINIHNSTSPTETPTESPTPTPTSSAGHAMHATLWVNGVDGHFDMTILDNACGRLLYQNLPKTISLTDRDKTIKQGYEDEILYTMDDYRPGTLSNGDFMLYGQSRYELCYKDCATGYSYTQLGKVINPEKLAAALGAGNVVITITPGIAPTSSPTASASYTPSQAPTATPTTPSGVTATPTGSQGPKPSGSVSPTPSSSVSPTPSSSVSPTPSTTPDPYSGPRIHITSEEAGQSWNVKVDTNNPAAMTFYNSLPKKYVMNPYQQTPIYRYMTRLTEPLANATYSKPLNIPAGALVLWGTDNLFIFVRTAPNASVTTPLEVSILGTFDDTISKDTSFLTEIFKGADRSITFTRV